MRDVAAIRRWLRGRALLEDLLDADLDALAERASWVDLIPGRRLHAAGARGDGVWLLVEGEIVVGDLEIAPADVDGVARRSITTPGYPVGWDGVVWPGRHRWDAAAAAPTRLLHVDRSALDDCRRDDGFAERFHQLLLWLAGTQLHGQHTRSIARRYDDETEAVAALIADRADELRVTSPLHRIAGYLRSRPTVGDALRALEVVRDGDDAVESQLAVQALELLAGVRRELAVFTALQRVYEAVASAPPSDEPPAVRARACRALVDLFSQVEHRVVGLDRLPPQPGSIVLCNHLRGHPTNRLPNGFSIILDTHFVSSMILYRTYGTAPVRVVRDSHWDEASHARYYARLGYVMVPSSEVDPLPTDTRTARRERFFREAAAVLRDGIDLVICPEGRTGPTQGSPRRLRSGAFMLASAVDPEPPIVPVALANFDARLSRATFGALVESSFRMSEVVDDPQDRRQVVAWVDDVLTPRYQGWVRQAAALA